MTIINKSPLAAITRRNNKFKYAFPLIRWNFADIVAVLSRFTSCRLRNDVRVNYSEGRNLVDSLTVYDEIFIFFSESLLDCLTMIASR